MRSLRLLTLLAAGLLLPTAGLAHPNDPHVCGNGIREAEEECDDGNDVETDGCSSACLITECVGPEVYASTFEALQDLVFGGSAATVGDACTECHSPQTVFNQRPYLGEGDAYSELVGVQSAISTMKLVEPGQPEQSMLYLKLAAKTLSPEDWQRRFQDLDVGTPMPAVASALTPSQLSAVYWWICLSE